MIEVEKEYTPEWKVIIDLLKYTDSSLYNRLARKMMNYLYKRNIKEAEEVMKKIEASAHYGLYSETVQNQPLPRLNQESLEKILDEIFDIADRNLQSQHIVNMLKVWLKQEQSRFLSLAAEKRDVSLAEITDAIYRFSKMPNAQKSLSPEERIGIKVALIRRFLSEDMNYINVTKKLTTVADFENNVLFGPTKAANAGGVATSALEMSQNSMRYSWTFEEVDTKLKQIMVNIYRTVSNAAKEYRQETNFVMGANIAGFLKVADVMIAQGII